MTARPVDADRATAMPAPYRRTYRYRCFECGEPRVHDHDLAKLVSPCHPDSVLMPWSAAVDLGYNALIQMDRGGQTDLAAFIEAHEPDVYISAPYFLAKHLANQMPTKEDMAVALACAEKWGKLTGRRAMAIATIDDPLAGWLGGDHHGYSRGRSR